MHARGRRRGRAAAALGVALVAAAAVAPAPAGAQPGPLPPILTATELAPLPGDPPGTVPVVRDVNERGLVVGSSAGRAALWRRDGAPVVLPSGAAATHVNDRGDVIVDVPGGDPYRWRSGAVTPLATDWAGGATARFLDEAGRVLLTPWSAPGSRNALWQDGTLTEIGSPDGLPLQVTGLSDAGHVIGETAGPAGRRPWLWHRGGFTALTAGPGGSTTTGRAVAVNAAGQVVGLAGRDGTTGVLWDPAAGTTTELGLVPADVNDRGQVAGVRTEGTRRYGYLWDGGVLTRLADLGPTASGPAAVNELGQVLGTFELGGTPHHFLWVGGYVVDLGPVRDPAQAAEAALNDAGEAAVSVAAQRTRPAGARVWRVDDVGEPPWNPDSCVVANNWAHVRDGRAVTYFGHTWAAGSLVHLGPLTATSALREEPAGTWLPVPSC
jgi:hypothetical protein